MIINEYHHYRKGYFFPVHFRITGTIAVLTGIYFILINKFIFGSMIIPFGFFLQFFSDGVEIRFNDKTYRNYSGLFGLKIGQWVPLPAVDYISAFKAKISQTANLGIISNTFEYKEIQINLIYEERKRIKVYTTENKEQAIEFAREIAKKLNVDILDATGQEQKWI